MRQIETQKKLNDVLSLIGKMAESEDLASLKIIIASAESSVTKIEDQTRPNNYTNILGSGEEDFSELSTPSAKK